MDRQIMARYREFGNIGSGAARLARVSWVRHLSSTEAAAITLRTVLGPGDGWDPRLRVAHPSIGRAIDLPLPLPPGSAVP